MLQAAVGVSISMEWTQDWKIVGHGFKPSSQPQKLSSPGEALVAGLPFACLRTGWSSSRWPQGLGERSPCHHMGHAAVEGGGGHSGWLPAQGRKTDQPPVKGRQPASAISWEPPGIQFLSPCPVPPNRLHGGLPSPPRPALPDPLLTSHSSHSGSHTEDVLNHCSRTESGMGSLLGPLC